MSKQCLFKPFTNIDDLHTAIHKGSPVFVLEAIDMLPKVAIHESLLSQTFKSISYMIYNKSIGTIRMVTKDTMKYVELVEGIKKGIKLEELLIMTAVYVRSTVSQMSSSSQSNADASARGIFTLIAFYSLSKTLTEIGPYLNRGRTTISKSKKVIEQNIDMYDHISVKVRHFIKFINKYHTLITDNGITTDQEFLDTLQKSEDWKDSDLGHRSFFDSSSSFDNN